MSPGATAARVYDALKVAILDGAFRPGARLDPARLSDSLAASATPVRDALQRLHGERLVDNARHEGFRVPLLTEPDLRDLYGWSVDLSDLLVRRFSATAGHSGQPPPPELSDYPAAAAEFFEVLARLAGTREHRYAIASLNDRLQTARRIEPSILAETAAEPPALFDALGRGDQPLLRALLKRYHQRRFKAVPLLAASLRPEGL